MKKLLIIVLALFATGALRAISRSECVTRVESCEAILREFMADPAYAVPANVLQSAHAIIIVNQFKGGFFIGVKDGYGVILVKKPSGQWSLPVLLDAGEASLGFQIGAKSVESVMIVTDDATPRLLFKERFNVGVDAKAVAGPRVAAAEHDNRPIVAAPVLVYTKSKGLYAGATLKAGYLTRDDPANFVLYHTTYTMPELLYSDWVQPVPEVQPLMDYVKQIAP
ncbi:lipid-binding SYLF domain-containing protein [Horticoccus luteus]|uniref:Lipid-binding SYLF domain-containing protein n=1 Tax=Horticoccus luteus TaxID=2862869 RepID=A0A8F9TVR7_9BACT|nr:lipid-binding SYLF domain-containing protein [Horticoccus luteus]QYM78663.1 lipid-binding SYLF domain-containing protein [Horticoccus luteus]